MSSNGHVRKIMEKTRRLPESVWHKILEVGREDPRRVIHSLKVGLALALVSLLYLLQPFFKEVGQNEIWAVMTVVLVLEYTAGATLYKGLNRGFGTLLAGSLAFLIEYIADESGRVFYAIFIGTSVFIIGTTATYLRFIPYIKKNYDYGVVIFLLTFNLITASTYHVSNVLRIARERIYMIAIGCGLSLVMSLLIFPIWSGEDLHNSTVSKLEGIARSIEACVNEYFQDAETEVIREKSSSNDMHKYYRTVLDSKSNDENLALFASWEARHSRHCYRHPWRQYVKVGAVLRHFVYTAVALHGCLESEIQAPRSIRALFKDPCIRVAGEVANVLLGLANTIKKRCQCCPDLLSNNLHEALQDLNAAIQSQPRLFLVSSHGHSNDILSAAPQVKHNGIDFVNNHLSKDTGKKELRTTLSKISTTSLEFSEALPFAAFASLLVEMVVRLELVIEQVVKLGKMACFKEFEEKPDIEIIVSHEREHFESPHLASGTVESSMPNLNYTTHANTPV